MPDTTAARAAITEAYGRHKHVMSGMSMALLKLQAAEGRLAHEDPPPRWHVDDPVWLADAMDGLQDALKACNLLGGALAGAVAEVAALVAEQSRSVLPDVVRCQVDMVHEDKSTARCVLPGSHLRDDADHLDEHGHRAPVLISEATIDEVERITRMFPDG